MAMTQAEWYRQQNEEQKARVDAAHELRMAQRRASIAADPGGFNPWEKKAVDDYYRQKEEARRFDTPSGNVRRMEEARERVAEYGMMGQRDAGMGAAQIKAEADRYAADRTFAGVEAQAKNAAEIARGKAEAEKWIAGRSAEATEAGSKREWGYTDENGTFHPGGRVEQAKAQGEAAAKIAEQNNQARIEQERIKAQAKTTAAAMAKDTRIAAAIGGNPMLANNPGKAQEMLEALAGAGLSAEEAAEIIERRNKQQGDKKGGLSEVEKFKIRAGESVDTGEVNARSQKIRSTYQQRGMGV